MEDKKIETSMMRGAVVLVITSFIVKILSAVYRVPFQNLVGDEGFYVYQQIYPIYGIAMTLALSGLPVYLSKLIASKESQEEQEKVVSYFFIVVSALSLVAFVILYLGAGLISKSMGDASLSPLIKVVSFIFLLVPFLSTYRGFYQGQMEMKPTALSQLAEQGSRVIVILAAGYLFMVNEWSVYKMGALATSGALVGGACGLLVLFIYGRKHRVFVWPKKIDKPRFLFFAKRLIIEGGTLCFFSAYLVVFQLVDSFTIKQYLVFGGLDETSAKIAKGVFDRGQPIVQLGLVIAVSMTATFLPTLTRFFVTKQKEKYQQTVLSYLKVSTAIASAAAVGLALILPYMNVALFSDNSGEITLSLFMLSVFFVSMIQSYQTIYQSQSLVKYQFVAALMGLFVKIIFTPLMTYYFKTEGASLSTLFGLIICLLVMHQYLIKRENKIKLPKGFVVKLSLNLTAMGGILVMYRVVLEEMGWSNFGRGASLMIALLGVLIGFSIYLMGMIQSKLFTKTEWEMIPFGSKIIKYFY